jgi:hypothetical protein
MSVVTKMIRKVIWSRSIFEFFQRMGVNFTKKHFYSPIPDTMELNQREELWTRESTLAGIDMNIGGQLHFVERIFPEYKDELKFKVNKADTKAPYEFYLNNSGFGLGDAGVLHLMIRHFKPRAIIEVGSGNSTLVSAAAVLKNQEDGFPCRLTAIEPYPREYLKEGFPGLDGLKVEKAENVEIDFFMQLGEDDILFIDSSHVMRIGNDVNFLYLEVLPRLKKGVIVHIHDIFLPYHYPKEGVIQNRTFWTEQYLLQAFLCLNNVYEVLFANYYMFKEYPDKMNAIFKSPQGYSKHVFNSFWIRRVG